MKVYFSVSWSNMTPEIGNDCKLILSLLNNMGHEVFPKNVLSTTSLKIKNQPEHEARQIEKSLTALKKNTQVSIYEISRPSLGIGQEISVSLALKKPVIGLYRHGGCPHVLRDQNSDLLQLYSYCPQSLARTLQVALRFASEKQSIRFNMQISPTLVLYLKYVSSKLKISQSNFVRKLIEDHMLADKSFERCEN